MTTLSDEAFSDLHQKMSKKIAQLTKVIYHLNTRNEDHQSELDAIGLNHESETRELMRDAANKIGKFKDLADVKNTVVRIWNRREYLSLFFN
jgi:Family with sequence similarity 184, A and B